MRTIIITAAACTASLFAPATLLAEETASAPAAAAQATADASRVICRPSGMDGHIAKTVCLTQKEWDAIRDADQRSLQRVQQRAMQSRVTMAPPRGH